MSLFRRSGHILVVIIKTDNLLANEHCWCGLFKFQYTDVTINIQIFSTTIQGNVATVSVLNFMGKIFVVCQKDRFVSVLNFVGIIFVV